MLDYEKSNVEFRISNVKSTLNYERHQWRSNAEAEKRTAGRMLQAADEADRAD